MLLSLHNHKTSVRILFKEYFLNHMSHYHYNDLVSPGANKRKYNEVASQEGEGNKSQEITSANSPNKLDRSQKSPFKSPSRIVIKTEAELKKTCNDSFSDHLSGKLSEYMGTSSSFGSKFPHTVATGVKRFQLDAPLNRHLIFNGISPKTVKDYLELFSNQYTDQKENIDKILQLFNEAIQNTNEQLKVKAEFSMIASPNGKLLENLFSTSTQNDESIISPLPPSSPVKHRIDNNPDNQNHKPFKVQTRAYTTSAHHDPALLLMTQKPDVWTNMKPEVRSSEPDMIKPELPQHNSAKIVKPLALSEEQSKVVELAKLGYSLFYTGSAGTGKSLILKSLIEEMNKKHPTGSVGVTASTGLAACNIGGKTLHSFTGIGIGEASVETLVKRIRRSKTSRPRWDALKVLIIDEISMIDGELLDKLDQLARVLKRKDEPFGGIQLILCGDFYQLPPVSKNRHAQFAFESKSWKQTIKHTIILNKIFRQQSDQDFVKMLAEVRSGSVSDMTIKRFKALEREIPPKEGVTPAQLFSTRREVDSANENQLRKLNGTPIKYDAIEGGDLYQLDTGKKLLENFLAPKSITLKVGAQVMMVKNVDNKLVNGSLGTVVDFVDPDTYFTYANACKENDIDCDFNVKDDKGSNEGIDIKNTEALPDVLNDSIFSCFKELKARITEQNIKEYKKSNSLPDDSTIDESELPSSSEDTRLQDIQRKEKLITELFANSKGRRLPLVNFLLPDGNHKMVLVEPERFQVEDEKETVLVYRVQLPLMLAWSISIHKSQGQTLALVSVDLKRVFEKGQAYVALSRATHRKGLQVKNFDASKVQTHPKVIDFYSQLVNVDEVVLKENNSQRNIPGKKAYGGQRGINALENLVANTADPRLFFQAMNKKKQSVEENSSKSQSQLQSQQVSKSFSMQDSDDTLDPFEDADDEFIVNLKKINS